MLELFHADKSQRAIARELDLTLYAVRMIISRGCLTVMEPAGFAPLAAGFLVTRCQPSQVEVN